MRRAQTSSKQASKQGIKQQIDMQAIDRLDMSSQICLRLLLLNALMMLIGMCTDEASCVLDVATK